MVRKVNGYMSRLFDFLNRLAMNNNREWFHQNKAEFDELRTLWLNDVQRLINLMAEYDESLKSVDAKDCVYRIYRDIRFSPNKLPYKTYFSTVVAQGGAQDAQGMLLSARYSPENAACMAEYGVPRCLFLLGCAMRWKTTSMNFCRL